MASDNSQPPKAAAPDVFGMDAESLDEKPFPRPAREYRVVLDKDAHESILAHAASNPEVELCGVLVGDLCRDADGPHLVITDTIRGRDAREDVSHVTFTHSTWDHIHKVMDEQHAGRRIVGWYHMHPGHGVFLSEVDLFAHRNFFNAAWQVSIVVDTKAMTQGLFVWEGGEVVRARRYWIGDELHWEPAERPSVSAPPGTANRRKPDEGFERKPPRQAEPEPRPDGPLGSLLTLVAIVVLALLFTYQGCRNEVRTAELARRVKALRAHVVQDSGAEYAPLARSLAVSARQRLDDGTKPDRLRSVYLTILALDPAHRRAYELMLPELAPFGPKEEPKEETPQKESPKEDAQE